MICRKYYSTRNRGMLLVDVLVAMSLAALFISIFTAATISSREYFERNRERMRNLVASSSVIVGGSAGSSVPFDLQVSASPVCSTDFVAHNIAGAGATNEFIPTIASIFLPISTSIPLTHLEIRDGIAYVSADSNVSADSDLFVFDISNVDSHASSSEAKYISSINTGPGIASFVLVGRRIFAAAASTAAQLHIIDFLGTSSGSGSSSGTSSLISPSLLKKYQLPLPYATATPPFSTAIDFATNESEHSGQIHLGTEKWQGAEFTVIDVTNPASPVWRNNLEIGSKVNEIHKDAGSVFISNAGQNQLIQIEVGDLRAGLDPTMLGTFSPSGWSRQTGQLLSTYLGRRVFGRTSGGYDISIDHELFLWASTTNQVLGAADTSLNIQGGVYGIVQDNDHIYAATRESGKEFQVYDSSLDNRATYPLPSAPHSMTCDGDHIFVLSNTSPTIYAISFK